MIFCMSLKIYGMLIEILCSFNTQIVFDFSSDIFLC